MFLHYTLKLYVSTEQKMRRYDKSRISHICSIYVYRFVIWLAKTSPNITTCIAQHNAKNWEYAQIMTCSLYGLELWYLLEAIESITNNNGPINILNDAAFLHYSLGAERWALSTHKSSPHNFIRPPNRFVCTRVCVPSEIRLSLMTWALVTFRRRKTQIYTSKACIIP